MSIINTADAFKNVNQQVGVFPSVVTTAHWKSDESAEVCSGCEIDFTMLRRRHHCRSCGEVLCDSCAPQLDAFHGTRFCLPCLDDCKQDIATRVERNTVINILTSFNKVFHETMTTMQMNREKCLAAVETFETEHPFAAAESFSSNASSSQGISGSLKDSYTGDIGKTFNVAEANILKIMKQHRTALETQAHQGGNAAPAHALTSIMNEILTGEDSLMQEEHKKLLESMERQQHEHKQLMAQYQAEKAKWQNEKEAWERERASLNAHIDTVELGLSAMGALNNAESFETGFQTVKCEDDDDSCCSDASSWNDEWNDAPLSFSALDPVQQQAAMLTSNTSTSSRALTKKAMGMSIDKENMKSPRSTHSRTHSTISNNSKHHRRQKSKQVLSPNANLIRAQKAAFVRRRTRTEIAFSPSKLR